MTGRKQEVTLQALLDRAAPPEEWTDSEQAAAWRRIESQLKETGTLSAWRWALPAVAAGLVISLSAPWWLRPSAPDERHPTSAHGGEGKGLEFSAQSVVWEDGPTELYLDQGEVRAEHPAPLALRITTPHAQLAVGSTRFLAAVSPAGTRITVYEGEVGVRSRNHARRLGRGETLEVPAEPGPAMPRALRARPLSSCGGERSIEGQRQCYRRLTGQDGLAAQNAWFALGLLEWEQNRIPAAERAWREHQRRYSGGPLAPEVSLHLFALHLHQGAFAQAMQEAAQFEARFPEEQGAAQLFLRKMGWTKSAPPSLSEWVRWHAQPPPVQPEARN